MEVITANDGVLTNQEVLEHIKSRKDQRGAADKNRVESQHRESIEIKVIGESSLYFRTPVT